jgi:hypothetical protein
MSRIFALILLVTVTFSVGSFAYEAEEAQLSTQAVQMLAASNPARACFNSADCLPGENCINGQCVFGRCMSDLDCAIGEHCVAGTCRR